MVPLWVNGQASPLIPERIYEVVNALENKVVHHTQSTGVEEAKASCEATAAAFPSWSKTPYWKRRNILFKVADLIESRANEIGAAHSLEISCTTNYGQFLPRACTPLIREVAAQLSTTLTDTIPPIYDRF